MNLGLGIILAAGGAFSLYTGIVNKGFAKGDSFYSEGWRKKILGSNPERAVRIISGIICLVIGVSLLFIKR